MDWVCVPDHTCVSGVRSLADQQGDVPTEARVDHRAASRVKINCFRKRDALYH